MSHDRIRGFCLGLHNDSFPFGLAKNFIWTLFETSVTARLANQGQISDWKEGGPKNHVKRRRSS